MENLREHKPCTLSLTLFFSVFLLPHLLFFSLKSFPFPTHYSPYSLHCLFQSDICAQHFNLYLTSPIDPLESCLFSFPSSSILFRGSSSISILSSNSTLLVHSRSVDADFTPTLFLPLLSCPFLPLQQNDEKNWIEIVS